MSFRQSNTRAAKLRPQDILDIRTRYASGETQGRLSRDYQISLGQIGRIVRGESWQQLPTQRTDQDIQMEMVNSPPPDDDTINASLDKLRQKLDNTGD